MCINALHTCSTVVNHILSLEQVKGIPFSKQVQSVDLLLLHNLHWVWSTDLHVQPQCTSRARSQ